MQQVAKMNVLCRAMYAPTRPLPNGTLIGVVLALFLIVPLFIAILVDVNSRTDKAAHSEAVFPGPRH